MEEDWKGRWRRRKGPWLPFTRAIDSGYHIEETSNSCTKLINQVMGSLINHLYRQYLCCVTSNKHWTASWSYPPRYFLYWEWIYIFFTITVTTIVLSTSRQSPRTETKLIFYNINLVETELLLYSWQSKPRIETWRGQVFKGEKDAWMGETESCCK